MKTQRSAELGVRSAESRRKRPLRIPHSAFRTPHSSSVRQLAERVLVGGVNSPVRAFRQVGGDPMVLVRAAGAIVSDRAGRSYIDFIMGWGAHILGHNPPAVVQAIRTQLAVGALMGLTHPAEAQLAARIAKAVRSVEQVRFTVSGTEACMTAVKLARAHTGRDKILSFEGCYHGHGESLIAGKSAGIPEALAHETVRVPYNSLTAFEQALARDGDRLAGVILEPVAANMGVVVPDQAFLARVRELTARRGIVLIFDEVVTGFRLGLGGAQQAFGVDADLTTFGKIIGGGMPIGAVGGPKRIMQQLAPEGNVYHGGTFAGHPLSTAAGLAMLDALKTHPPYRRLDQLGKRLTDGLLDAARRAGVFVQVSRIGSMLTVRFNRTEQFAHWANTLRRKDILIPPSPAEVLFLSTAHTEQHIERTIRASRIAFASLPS